jgi:PAS domain S-box-containing protein
MTYVITPYVLISAFAALVAAAVGVVAWRRRAAPGGSPLVALMVTIGIWSAGAAMEYATVGIPGKLMWAQIQYIGVVTCPVFFLLVALEYSRQDRWLTRRTTALFFIVPLITLILAVTNQLHGLIWPTITPTGAPAANLALYGHGLGFYIGCVAYSYLLMLIGTILLVRAAFHFPIAYRRQAGMLVAGALAPWLVNFVYVAGLSPIPGLELTPLVMALTGVLFVWGIFGYQLLDLAPVARETLIETMADGMVVLDAQDRVVDINPSAQHLLGAATAFQVGQSAEILFTAWPDWTAHLGSEQADRIEMSMAGAAKRYLELTISPIRSRHGHYAGRLIVIHDITERKAAQTQIELLNDELEMRVEERTQALLMTQERFGQVIASITDHVFATQINADGSEKPIYRSPRLSELTGFPTDYFGNGTTEIVAQIVHPEDRPKVMASVQPIRSRGSGELEYRIICADGAIRWVRTSLRVQTIGQDCVVYGVTSDITERKRMEETMVEIRALAELDKLRTELVGNVSHELRTPLGLIKAASTTLLRRDVTFPCEVQQRILQGITDETDRLEHLVSNLLDISRLDQQRFFLQRTPTDLNSLVTAAVDAARCKLADETTSLHRLILQAPKSPIEAQIDARKIEQVLDNLLQNAIRYSPSGGNITVSICADSTICTLRVVDEGIGIAAEDQVHIFERFYRARDARVQQIRGAGLGLAICCEIVKAHAGTLCVESNLDRGSTFIVHLPREKSRVSQ